MQLRVVKDDNLDAVFGARLAEDLRAHVHDGGDCRACGRLIGPADRVRLEVVSQPYGLQFVWARHATCTPPAPTAFQQAVFTPLTWSSMAALIPITTQPASAFYPDSEPELLPVVVLNPSREGFTLLPPTGREWPATVVACYVEHGFNPAGVPDLTHRDGSQFAGQLVVSGVQFDLPPYGWGYSAPLATPITKQIRARGGFLLILTHAVVGEDVNQAGLDALLTGRDYVQAWITIRFDLD